MASSHVVQSNFLSGVLDPRASARIETDAYNSGLLRGINIEPIHLGGVRRRRGLRYCATLPNILTRVSSGVTATAPNGGTAANANDDNETTLLTTTTNIGTTDPYVIVHYDLGSAKAILFADIVLASASAAVSLNLAIQYSTDNAAWTSMEAATLYTTDNTARSFRATGPATARYWRVARSGGLDLGTAKVNLAGFNLWQDSGVVSEGRVKAFEVATDERYEVVFTDRSATIFEDGTLLFRQPTPYASADIGDIDVAADAETMVIVHEDYAPRFLIRESTAFFQCFPADFDALPEIDFEDTSSPTPTSDVQTMVFSGWNTGDTFQVHLDGAHSAATVYSGDNATTADNLAREIQKLWTVKGFSGVTGERTGVNTFVITSAGASADAYGLMTVSPVTGSGTVAVTHTTTGVSRKEPVWSATRGYPRTTEFFEGRLYFGGTRSKQKSLIGSQVNNILHLEIGEGLDDDPVFVTLSGNGNRLNAIQGLFGGRSLQVFASGGEFRYAKEQGVPITPGDVPVNQTQYGTAKIHPVNIDGATIYVQRNRKSIRDFRFDYAENAYNSLGVSALAPHLIYDVRDLAAWNGSVKDEIGLVFVVNGENPDTSAEAFQDGTVAVFNSRKEAKIQAWTIWTTAGLFRSVCTILEDIFFLVERTLNGTTVLCFEKADPDYYTDCAVQVVNSPASTAVAGLGHLNGEECRVRADGFVLENVTPSGGSATIQQASSNIEIGLDWTPEATPMPLQTITPLGSNLMRKKRVVNIKAKVRNTLGLRVNGRPLPDRYFDVDNFDEAATPFSGIHEIEESTNWDQAEDKLVSFTQVDPLPFELLGLDIQIESSV